jgi:sarcosine oxidase
MTPDVDVAVVGLGAMGAAVAWQAAAAGLSVAGFDAYDPPHQLGSTHGHSRIIREAYFEHPQYVPLVQRAYELWAALETTAAVRLFQATGGLMIGAEGSVLIEGTLRAAREHGLPVQTWTAAEVASRVPPLSPPPGMVGVFEPRAGVLAPERGVRAMLQAARQAGAALHGNERVERWEADTDGIEIRTAARRVLVRHLVLAAGSWMASELARLPRVPLTVERVVQHWYRPGADPRFAPSAFPVFLLEAPDGRMLYGLPDQGQGLKLAQHHGGRVVTPDTVDREIGDDESARFHAWASAWVHGLPGTPVESRVCLYTNTPDSDFVLDWHPEAPRVFVCSACSGHGFKFAPAIGELVTRVLSGGLPLVDLAPFRIGRFG